MKFKEHIETESCNGMVHARYYLDDRISGVRSFTAAQWAIEIALQKEGFEVTEEVVSEKTGQRATFYPESYE